jgi:hypothetical protein
VDWLHVWFYGPTFNLADIWLRGGVLIAASGWLWHRRTRDHLPPPLAGGPSEMTSPAAPASESHAVQWGLRPR